jgi:arsenate reductase
VLLRPAVADVLFTCVANAGRSVIAERLFNRVAAGRHRARSAGSEPGDAVHPVVLAALAEIGIDASDHVPCRLEPDDVRRVDVVVSTCGDEACAAMPPGVTRIAWDLPDPKHRPIEEVRALRDEIEQRVATLVAELDERRRSTPPLPPAARSS